MNKRELAYILEKRKWPRMWRHTIGHIMFMIIPVGLLSIYTSMWYGGITYGHIYENHYMNSFFITAFIGAFLSLFLLIYFIIKIKNQRKFRIITTSKNYDGKDLLNIVRDLGWKGSFDREKKHYPGFNQNFCFFMGRKNHYYNSQ